MKVERFVFSPWIRKDSVHIGEELADTIGGRARTSRTPCEYGQTCGKDEGDEESALARATHR